MVQLKNIPKPKKVTTILAQDAFNSDIVAGINSAFFNAISQTRGMAQGFKGASRMATAFNIWAWVKNNIPYKRDPDQMQMIKLPSHLIHDENGGDCKSMTLLASALMFNNALPVVIRYVSYSANPTPTHVYSYTYDKDGTPIVIDCVYNKFNDEAPFRSKKDYLMKLKES